MSLSKQPIHAFFAMLFFLATLSLSSLSPSKLPFRLQLEDVRGSSPCAVKCTHVLVALSMLVDNMGLAVSATRSAHVVVAAPLSARTEVTLPIDAISRISLFPPKISLVDSMCVFTSDTPCFRCIVTGIDADVGIASRIDGTDVWILCSNYVGGLDCNELKSSLSREDFSQLQREFMFLCSP